MNIFIIIVIAVCLSMDAFSLSLVYGMNGIEKKDKFLLSFIVGIYHFFMTLLGNSIGYIISSKIILNLDKFVAIILIILSFQMLIDTFKTNEKYINYNYITFLLFGFSVSIDSLSLGIGLSAITNKYLLSYIIFSITSFLFTMFGLNLGDRLNKKIGKYSTILSSIILFIIGIIYILK